MKTIRLYGHVINDRHGGMSVVAATTAAGADAKLADWVDDWLEIELSAWHTFDTEGWDAEEIEGDGLCLICEEACVGKPDAAAARVKMYFAHMGDKGESAAAVEFDVELEERALLAELGEELPDE